MVFEKIAEMLAEFVELLVGDFAVLQYLLGQGLVCIIVGAFDLLRVVSGEDGAVLRSGATRCTCRGASGRSGMSSARTARKQCCTARHSAYHDCHSGVTVPPIVGLFHDFTSRSSDSFVSQSRKVGLCRESRSASPPSRLFIIWIDRYHRDVHGRIRSGTDH